ncbi:MAG: response regulator [Opitutaceae bacterium]
MARILIIDDCLSVRITLDYCLRAAGHEIVLAENASAGMRRATEGGVDLVLADVNMPGMDGVAMCWAMRDVPSLREIPILLMTGCPTQETLGRARAAGARAVLSKPFEMDELVKALRSHLPAGIAQS